MGLPNLTPEEEYLLKKFSLLKKKVTHIVKSFFYTGFSIRIRVGGKSYEVGGEGSNHGEHATF